MPATKMNLKVFNLLSFGSAVAFSFNAIQSPLACRQNQRRLSPLPLATLDDSGPVESAVHHDDDNIGAWVPIHSVSSLRGLGPQRITTMGLDLVVWEGLNETWSVMTDACPHRLAPLSQGRVDTETGCIECPYHGWQFDFEGSLIKVHSSREDPQTRAAQCGISLRMHP